MRATKRAAFRPADEPPATDVHVLGRDTREQRLTAEQCPQLKRFCIKHLGVSDAAAPMHIFRANTGGTFLLACDGGAGQVMLEGRWMKLRESMACLSPAHIRYALRALPGTRWQFCWVRYEGHDGEIPAPLSGSPIAATFNAGPLRSAIVGLQHESAGTNDPAAIALWVELIHLYVLRFAHGNRSDPRLTRLWQTVDGSVGDDWSLETLARVAGVSREHLRRLCQAELGRSPLQHLLSLRMRKAMQLLTGNDKMEVIAEQVGYGDLYSFSKAFRRWSGFAPSAFRKRG
jgi:AraC-like DNA-binding protein